LQQEGMGQPLGQRGAVWNGLVVHPVIGDGCADNGQADCGKIGNGEAQVTLPDQRQRRTGERLPVVGQGAGSQKAADNQKDLHRHPCVFVKPAERTG
jgi:hypothetical protein